ncbi:MAG: FMN-binding protein, partial [Peptoniphilaceae bacterium]
VNYTLRIFKEGYNAKEEQFNLSAGNNNREFTLEAQGQMQEEEYKYDTGNMNRQADQNYRIGSTGYQGGAVKFIPKKIGGTISSISIQFGPLSDLQTYSRCKVSIKQLDKRGRLLEIMEPMEINFQPNKVKTISVAQYQIKTDEPYYVVVEKIDDSGNILIGLDQSGDRDYSYIYGGNNLFPLYPNLVYGALMIRSTMNYPVDADTINYHVNKPVLDPIHPSAKEVKGKAEAKQGIQLFFQDGLRINDMADANGNFSIAVRRTMIPGEEVLAYAKDENGIKSDPAKGIILTDPEILLDNIKLAKDMKDEKPGTEANKKLKNAVSEAELLLENINSYEVGELIDKSKIKEYQNEINNKVKELRDLMLALSPDKERLKKEIDIAMEDLSNIWISPNGRDIPETKDWVMQKDWTIFNSKLLKARGVYQDTAATVQRTRNAIKDLKDAKTIFDSSKQKGYEKVLIINEKYEDGIYEGEGRGTSLLASHVVIQVSKGRIVDVKITDWNESEASKKAIELEGFLDKIVNENALDIKPIKGYEIEYRAIIKAINQAIEKGLKEGEPINTDKTPLSNAINRAKTFLNKYPVSDGQNIGEEVEWVTQENHNLLKQQIAVAEEEYKKDLTIDGRDKAITILETAVRNFLSQLERGPKDVVVPIGYKDGEYLVKTHGQNAMNKNEFKVTISNGKITSIEIISWADTPGFDNKIEPLIRNIINENSPEVDVVSKATNSSNSVKEAVKLALEMAKKTEDPENPVDPADIEKSLNNLKSEILSAKKLLYKTQIEGSILKVKREFIVNRSKLYLPR